jgi:hypothetical protein
MATGFAYFSSRGNRLENEVATYLFRQHSLKLISLGDFPGGSLNFSPRNPMVNLATVLFFDACFY